MTACHRRGLAGCVAGRSCSAWQRSWPAAVRPRPRSRPAAWPSSTRSASTSRSRAGELERLEPSLEAEVRAARRTWPLVDDGLDGPLPPRARAMVARAAARAQAIVLPASFRPENYDLTGPASDLASLLQDFNALAVRGWQVILEGSPQGGGTRPRGASSAKTRASMSTASTTATSTSGCSARACSRATNGWVVRRPSGGPSAKPGYAGSPPPIRRPRSTSRTPPKRRVTEAIPHLRLRPRAASANRSAHEARQAELLGDIAVLGSRALAGRAGCIARPAAVCGAGASGSGVHDPLQRQ